MKADRHIKLIFSNKVVKRHGMKHEVYYILAEETTDLLVSFTFLKNIPKRTRAIMRSFIFVAVALSHDCRITQQSSWKKRSSRIESQPAIMSRLNCISPVTAAPTFEMLATSRRILPKRDVASVGGRLLLKCP